MVKNDFKVIVKNYSIKKCSHARLIRCSMWLEEILIFKSHIIKAEELFNVDPTDKSRSKIRSVKYTN